MSKNPAMNEPKRKGNGWLNQVLKDDSEQHKSQ